jgi:hypothetical protein
MTRRKISEFGRVYDYLNDVKLRLKEIGKDRVTIEGAEFAGSEFLNGYWGFYDFVNCHFAATHNIQLVQLAECTFTDCEFGPSADNDTLDFGKGRKVVFKHCKFYKANAGFSEGDALFNQCECDNPNTDPNHGYGLSGPDITFYKCKTKNYTLLSGQKLTLQSCTIDGDFSSRHIINTPATAEFAFLNTTFKEHDKMLWGVALKNLTIRGCVAEGSGFYTQGSDVTGTMILENLTEGYFDTSGGGPDEKLIVRNCSFKKVSETGFYFRCTGGYSKETVIERISVPDSNAPVNLTGAGDKTTEKFRLPKTQNHLFVVRNSKIPHLKINWLQSLHLRIENCEIGKLEIRDGLIGLLEIKNSRIATPLDIANTFADEYAISDYKGDIISTGSNYNKATGKATGKRKE